MKKKSLLIGCVICCCAAASIVTGLYLHNRNNCNEGITLVPSKEYEPTDIPYYLQHDSQWADDRLGTSIYTMKSSGCLTTSLAASLSAQGSSVITPKELNQLFTDYEVYNSNGDIVWGNIHNALEQVDVYVAKRPDADEIEQLLAEKTYPVVKVKYLGSGAWHWVVIIGADERGYLCMDSLNPEISPQLLSVHGNIVYSMRMVSWKT